MATSAEHQTRLGSSWFWMALLAVISIIGGMIALFNPFAATVTAVFIAGWFFVVMGALQIIQAFRVPGWPGFIWGLLFGVLMLLVGIGLLHNPLEGMVTLTVLVASVLLVTGVVKFVYSFSLRPIAGWAWVLLSGLVSLLLALMIFANFPWSATQVLGIFLGIELLSNGVLFLFVALGLRRLGA